MASKITRDKMLELTSDAFVIAAKLSDADDKKCIRQLAAQARWMLDFIVSQNLWLECWRHKKRITRVPTK